MTAFITLLAFIAQIAVRPSYLLPTADIEERTVTVAHIYDGDTFRGDDGRDYRLAGINTPEIAHPEHGKFEVEPGGPEATAALRALIENRTVTALVDRDHSTDRYGRTVAIIQSGGQDVNLEMLRSGLAEPRYIDLSPMIDESAFLAASRQPDSNVSRQAATREDVTVASHVLAPGDRLRIVVGNQTEDFTINPDGEILIKGLGVFRAGGMTSPTATATLDSAIRARGIVRPVTIFYLAPPARVQRNVIVLGAVKRPGIYQASTLLAALSAAEGFIDASNPTAIRITAGDSSTTHNAQRILAGDSPDVPLSGGEVIAVPSLPRILVSGAIAKPDWVSALTLSEAVSAAGGVTPDADLERVEVRSSIDTPARINLATVFRGDTDDPILPDRTRVTVPFRPRAIVPLVQVYGPVERPGTTEAFTLADAIREAQPDTRADLESVILERSPGDTTTLNAREIALGHALDTDLVQGNRVLIPRRPEATADTPQTVTVLGDVAHPGPVPPGPLTAVLASAGGTKTTARLSAIHVRLPDGHSQTYDLARITTGRQPDPDLLPNSTVFVESDEPRRQSMSDLRTFIGIISAVVLLGLKLSL